MIICVVENTVTREVDFYFLKLTDSWLIAQHVDPGATLKLTIFGLKSGQPKILLSAVCDNLQQQQIPQMVLQQHSKKNSLLTNTQIFGLFHNLTLEDNIRFNVDQRINVLSGKQNIVFRRDQSSQRWKQRSYIQIIQTTSSTNDVSSYNEYIELATTYTNEIQCVNLPSREAVNYKIYRVSPSGNKYHVTKTTNQSQFITHNSKDDVHRLHNMASSFIIGSGTMPIPYLYRNKPSFHPTIVEVKETGIMTKYDKDNNGDQASSINHNIKGLFFSASMDKDTHQPQTSSFFGDYRILIPPEHLIPGLNLYFADFYCNYKAHYVTLVLTKPGSVEDVYCKPRLIKLDINDNKFLYCDRGFYYTTSERNLWVEVLYTEDVHVEDMSLDGKLFKKTTPIKGLGQSKPDGIPKNTSCQICNLPKRPYITRFTLFQYF
ncbi:hypothetical protein SNE40_013331 [Patella caerulea]|uniref:Phytanoyl-CoA hydroxylase-interacting protein-like C-terminal domain-containing protein n=1 Tax=Patella caerulea TaxID=87958 RepID=A0AAN8PTI6_PATCE